MPVLIGSHRHRHRRLRCTADDRRETNPGRISREAPRRCRRTDRARRVCPGGDTRSSVRESESARISSACANGSLLPASCSSGVRLSARFCTRSGSGLLGMAPMLSGASRSACRLLLPKGRCAHSNVHPIRRRKCASVNAEARSDQQPLASPPRAMCACSARVNASARCARSLAVLRDFLAEPVVL